MLALQSGNHARALPGRGDASTRLDLVRPHLARYWAGEALPDEAPCRTSAHALGAWRA